MIVNYNLMNLNISDFFFILYKKLKFYENKILNFLRNICVDLIYMNSNYGN